MLSESSNGGATMGFRPWLVTSALFGAMLFNLFLCGFEDVNAYAQRGPTGATAAPTVPDIRWTEGERAANLRTFGLAESEIDAVNRKIKRSPVDDDQIRAWLDANREHASRIFCASDDTSTAYRAASLLVRETVPGSAREVIPLDDVLADYAEQPWYKAAQVDELYRRLETRDRPAAATVYGVGSLIASEERPAIAEGPSVFVTYDRFLDDHDQMRPALVAYFAELVPLAETANARGGICGQRGAE